MAKRGGAHRRGGVLSGRVLSMVGLLLALAVLVAGAVMLAESTRQQPGADPNPPRPAADADVGRAADPADGELPVPALAPETLSLGRLGVSASILDATVPDGVLTPPYDVSQVGKWVDGAALDSDSGTVLLAGHVNMIGQGNGALFNLALMRSGDLIHTSDAQGAVSAWRVTSVVERPKSEGIEESVLDGADGPRRLAVVTCGGDLEYADGVGDYEDNIYLYAELVD